MPPVRQQVNAERKGREGALGASGDVGARPGVAQVRELLLMRVFIPAPAVLVVGGNGAVVVAADAGDTRALDERDGFVGPRCVPHQIAQVVDGFDIPATGDVGQYRLERRQVGVISEIIAYFIFFSSLAALPVLSLSCAVYRSVTKSQVASLPRLRFFPPRNLEGPGPTREDPCDCRHPASWRRR